MSERLLVEVCDGGRYAPCAYTYRIVSEREHRRAMAQVESAGGPVPEDERDDNVLLSEDGAYDIVPARHRTALREGWTVRFLLDRFEAFTIYGYDASDLA